MIGARLRDRRVTAARPGPVLRPARARRAAPAQPRAAECDCADCSADARAARIGAACAAMLAGIALVLALDWLAGSLGLRALFNF